MHIYYYPQKANSLLQFLARFPFQIITTIFFLFLLSFSYPLFATSEAGVGSGCSWGGGRKKKKSGPSIRAEAAEGAEKV
jgi:hypothetical protein